MKSSNQVSTLAIVAALIAIVAFVTAAVMFTTGDTSLERLAVLVAVIGTIVPGLVTTLRADQAQSQTNGSLDQRIADAVTAALQARRSGDRVTITEDPRPDPAATPVPPTGG